MWGQELDCFASFLQIMTATFWRKVQELVDLSLPIVVLLRQVSLLWSLLLDCLFAVVCCGDTFLVKSDLVCFLCGVSPSKMLYL